MKQLFKVNRYFLVLYLIVLIGAGAVLLLFEKPQIHLYINRNHSLPADYFFKIFTNFGDGLVPVFIGTVLLFFSFRKALLLGISTAFAGILAQVLKRFVFTSEVRPKVYFEKVADLYFVPGVEIHSWHSFPSGHTATAFSMFFILAMFIPQKWTKILFFSAAILIAYSRMYLSQHFLIDVYFGSLIGIISAIIISLLINRSQKKWMDMSIISIFDKRNEERS